MPLRLSSPAADVDRTAASTLLSPGWSRSRGPFNTTRRQQEQNNTQSFRDSLLSQAEQVHNTILKTFRKMSILQRVLAVFGLIAVGVLGLLFLIYNEAIFEWLQPFADKWKHTTGGWTILWALTFLAAFPPVLGYSICGTLAGFVYGIGEGWLILATATVVGSFCSFVASRTIMRKYVERMVANDTRFAALTLTLKQDGLKLLCMIRLCPLPYSLSNGIMSTFPSVEPHMYALATAIVTPKLFVHVFIGSRLAVIAREGGQMSLGARAVNYLSIVIGAGIGVFTGRLIYQRTMARAQDLEAEEFQNSRDSFRRTGAPPAEFADDPEAQTAAHTLAMEDDDVAYFDDAPSPKPPYSDSNSDTDVFDQGDGVAEEPAGRHGPKK